MEMLQVPAALATFAYDVVVVALGIMIAALILNKLP